MSTFMTKDGRQIYYKDWGTGQPVVFSHGWRLSSDSWEAQMPFLASSGYRSIAHDRRGHGRSSQSLNGNDMDTYADDLAEFIEKLDLKGTVLVGFSAGGGEVARDMLRKTVLPVIAIVLCIQLFLAISGCSGTIQTQGVATMTSISTSESTSIARQPLSTIERPASFTDKQWLGKQLFFDPNLSQPPGQACMDCHDPAAGWADPNQDSPTSAGNIPSLFGDRNSPTVAYASFSPDFDYDDAVTSYVGGQFWDGRAKNVADQAKGPILNPLEMNTANKQSVLVTIRTGPYANLFMNVWGANVFENTEIAYGDLAASIAEYEKTSEFNSFSSKYDDVLSGSATLTDQEKRGLDLFNGKAMCSKCHTSSADPASGKVLFTDFSYDNAGVPKNPENKFYALAAKYNPAGVNFVDLGLGGQLKIPSENGKFKVPSLRNVALTAPYMHNGFFMNLTDVVRFYNTRDVASASWPAPEVAQNVNKQDMGNLNLTDSEIKDIVVFLNTLTDTKFPKVK